MKEWVIIEEAGKEGNRKHKIKDKKTSDEGEEKNG